MYLYLIRHGETIWNQKGKTQGKIDIPLSDIGIHQAELVADRLTFENITYIYCSSLERAFRTAAIIGEKIGIKPVKTDDLCEISFGTWEGLTLQQIEDRFPGQLEKCRQDFCFCPEGGESIMSVHGRVCRFLDALRNNGCHSENSRILIVAHAYTIRLLIIELIGLPLKHLWDFRLDNTGISIIESRSGKSRIICLNDTCHVRKI